MPSVILAGTTTGTALSLTSDTSGELQIRTNNGATTAMTLTTGGNVGIGSTSPGQRLAVWGPKANTDLDSQGQLFVRDTAAWNASPAAGIQFGVQWGSAGQVGVGCSIQGIKENATDGNFAQAMLFTTQSDSDSPRERMRINSNGLTTVNTQDSGNQLDLFAGRISSAFTGTVSGHTSTKYSVIAGGQDINGTSGNAWAMSNAVSLGLFNLSAGCYAAALTTTGSTAPVEYRYFGLRGASILTLSDAIATITVGSLPNAGGQTAGTVVTQVTSQNFDSQGLAGRGTASGRLGGSMYSFHFERNGAGTVGNYMAMGNGGVAIAGIRMPFAGRVIQGTLYGDGFTGSIIVDVSVNGAANTAYRMSITGTAANAGVNGDWQPAPLTFAAGDVLGYVQNTVPSSADGYTASMYVIFD
jgi:hypothetical protein